MEVTLFSTLTYPNCNHPKTEEMPSTAVGFFTNAKTTKPFCAQTPAIAVCIVLAER